MDHTGSLVVILFAVLLGVGGLSLAGKPEQFLELPGWPMTLERRIGRRGAIVVLRYSGVVLTLLIGWLLIHEVRGLIP